MITIGGIDYTEYVDQRTLSCFKKKTTMNDMDIELHSDIALNIKVGQELLFTVNGTLEFGGLIQSVSSTHWPSYIVYSIDATAYEQITDRRTIQVDYNAVTAGSVVSQMVSIMADEGITAGTIDTGATISYVKNAVSIREVLNEMATASGYIWYINDNKELYFQADYQYTDGGSFPADYALTNSDQTLKSYSNKVFVLGAKDEDGLQIIGSASDGAEQARMASLFGSGVYGIIIRSSATTSDAEADILASRELSKRSYEHDGIRIQSRNRLEVGNYYLGVTVPEAFISNQDYVIDEVRITGNSGSGYVYNARLVAYSPSIISYDERWQEKFRQFQNVNDEGTAISSSVILAQRISASENIDYSFVLANYTITDTVQANTQTPVSSNPTESIDYSFISTNYTINDTATSVVS